MYGSVTLLLSMSAVQTENLNTINEPLICSYIGRINSVNDVNNSTYRLVNRLSQPKDSDTLHYIRVV